MTNHKLTDTVFYSNPCKWLLEQFPTMLPLALKLKTCRGSIGLSRKEQKNIPGAKVKLQLVGGTVVLIVFDLNLN